MKTTLSEVDIALAVVKYFEHTESIDIYKEVQYERNGRVADIVVKGPEDHLHVIEVKKNLNMSVLTQAIKWVDYADYVSIATPLHLRRVGKGHDYTESVFQRHGQAIRAVLDTFKIGHYGVHQDYRGEIVDVDCTIGAKLNPKPVCRHWLRDALCELQKLSVAGSAFGGHVTQFKITAFNVNDFIKKHGRSWVRDVVKYISHHYASDGGACHGIVQAIREKLPPYAELEVDYRHGKNMIQPREPSAAIKRENKRVDEAFSLKGDK